MLSNILKLGKEKAPVSRCFKDNVDLPDLVPPDMFRFTHPASCCGVRHHIALDVDTFFLLAIRPALQCHRLKRIP